MARTNKYASLNFNDIYEKKSNTNNPNNNNKQNSSSSSSSLTSPNKTILSNSRIHGNMLVLSRPTPKPIPQPSPPPPQNHQQPPPTSPVRTGSEPDLISLRPLGRTGSGPTITVSSPVHLKEGELSVSPKPNKFVPPHLRPGFIGREEKPVQLREFRQGGSVGSPNRVGENGRPKSGGGYEMMMKSGGESDSVEMKRPGSSGARRVQVDCDFS